jgi:hypothetical protein
MVRLTVKLRGHTEAPDWSRGRKLSSRARGDTTALHGPLQRLLDGMGHPLSLGSVHAKYWHALERVEHVPDGILSTKICQVPQKGGTPPKGFQTLAA